MNSYIFCLNFTIDHSFEITTLHFLIEIKQIKIESHKAADFCVFSEFWIHFDFSIVYLYHTHFINSIESEITQLHFVTNNGIFA